MPDLPREAFEIRDNGTPTPLTVFSNEVQPITVALMLDMSGSMSARFLRVRDGTLRFIDALTSPDRRRIGSFGAEIALSPLLTGNKAVRRRIALEELWPTGSTPMWNAITAAMYSLANESGRRVVLILTDGIDTGGLSGWAGSAAESRRMAVRDEFMIYAIGVQSLISLQGELVRLTEDTEYVSVVTTTNSAVRDFTADDLQVTSDDVPVDSTASIASCLQTATPAAATTREAGCATANQRTTQRNSRWPSGKLRRQLHQS